MKRLRSWQMSSKVTIGIQARSTSKRFPGKVFEMLGTKTVLRHVIDSCQKAATYINNWGSHKIHVDVALCIPYDDPIKRTTWGDVSIIEGPEDDVLMRYVILAEHTKSDYIVRITADCPLIPSFIINKCITSTVMNEYDYFSNVDERVRTTSDGFDCEVISKKLLYYTGEHATKASDREHVTTFIRSNPPDWIKQGIIINFLDLSKLKLSLDTQEDLERIKIEYGNVQDAFKTAQQIFGRRNVHRL